MREKIQKVRYKEITVDEYGLHRAVIGDKAIPIPPGSARSFDENIISMPDWWIVGNQVEAFVEE